MIIVDLQGNISMKNNVNLIVLHANSYLAGSNQFQLK